MFSYDGQQGRCDAEVVATHIVTSADALIEG